MHAQLLAKMREFVDRLAGPPTPADEESRWTGTRRAKWLGFFKESLGRLERGEPPDDEFVALPYRIARALDDAGLTGELAAEASAISKLVRALYRKEWEEHCKSRGTNP